MPDIHNLNARVDTAFGGGGDSLAAAAPHLFGPEARQPELAEHMPHAVEFGHAELAVAAAHVQTVEVREAMEAAQALARAGELASPEAVEESDEDAPAPMLMAAQVWTDAARAAREPAPAPKKAKGSTKKAAAPKS